MSELTDDQKIHYLKRSYSAVDGLWFMKLEEIHGFDKALEMDREVWKVMPKIQARFLKSVFGLDEGMEALRICFSEKLRLDGCEFTIENSPAGFNVIMTGCPWHETMTKSGRERLSGWVGEIICNTEFSGWASEFSNIACEITDRICSGSETCVVRFRRGET